MEHRASCVSQGTRDWNKALIQSQLKSVGFFSINYSAIGRKISNWPCGGDHFGWPHVLFSSIKAALRVCKAQRRLCVRLCNQETGGCQVPLLSPAFFFLHNFIQVEHRERDFLHLPLPGQKLGMDFLLPGDIRAPHCPQPGPAGSSPASHGCVLPTRPTQHQSHTVRPSLLPFSCWLCLFNMISFLFI